MEFARVNDPDWRAEILREKSRVNMSSRALSGEVKGIGKLSGLGQRDGSEIILHDKAPLTRLVHVTWLCIRRVTSLVTSLLTKPFPLTGVQGCTPVVIALEF